MRVDRQASASGQTTLSPTRSRVHGCLLGGAVGDALGAPVEFLGREEIVQRFGPGGIHDYAPCYGRDGAITDDTQMTLFTAEGLIRAAVRYESKGICHPPGVVHHAYLRWLKTQGEALEQRDFEVGMDGWLVGVEALWSCRAPGMTCLSALRQSRWLGDPARNDSKGCGTVMRTAPVGIVVDRDRAFEFGSKISALTHGNLTASLSAGFLSVLIAALIDGEPLAPAVESAKRQLAAEDGNREVMDAVERAQTRAASGPAAAASVEQLGAGWIAEEAVAIALYCVLATTSFEEAVVLAVNHSGDSDSTGAIAGNVAGALYGLEEIPRRWLDGLELRTEIAAVADDLMGVRDGTLDLSAPAVWERYPGW